MLNKMSVPNIGSRLPENRARLPLTPVATAAQAEPVVLAVKGRAKSRKLARLLELEAELRDQLEVEREYLAGQIA